MKKKYAFPLNLLIILIWIIISIVSALSPYLNETLIIIVLGIPVFILIPGYLLMAIFFPALEQLEEMERISLSLGSSIVLTAFTGLILNSITVLKLSMLLLVLCLFSLILIIIAIYRLSSISREERYSGFIENIYQHFIKDYYSKSKLDIVMKIIIIFSILSGIIMTMHIITAPVAGDKFTEFYILGTGGKAENYPSELKKDYSAGFKVGVVNHEYAVVNYTLEVVLDKQIMNQTRFSIGHNTTWENYINFVPDKIGDKMKLEFWLFKGDDLDSPYRDLHIWVNVK